MNKFTKIAVSFLLIISLVFNPLSSSFEVRAYAAAEAVGVTIIYIINSFLTGVAMELGKEVCEAIGTELEWAEKCEQSAINGYRYGVGVTLDNMSGTGSLTAYRTENAELTAEQAEFADFFVNYVNSHPEQFVIEYNAFGTNEYGTVIDSNSYARVKSAVTSAYSEYLTDKLQSEAIAKNMPELAAALDFENIKFSDFGFVGPQPSLTMPVISTTQALLKDGFTYTVPWTYTNDGTFASKEACLAAGFTHALENTTTGRWSGMYSLGDGTEVVGYGLGTYCIYNGNVYYHSLFNYDSAGYMTLSSRGYLPSYSNANSWYGVDGTTLFDAGYIGGEAVSLGFYLNKLGSATSSLPVEVIKEEDFTKTSGGGSAELPRTEQEELVGSAIGLGLISPDAVLEIGQDGTITSVDGITISKLQELCDLMAEGNLAFEDVQTYLEVMTQLIQTGNFTEAEQKKLLDNINANTAAIAKALEGEYELEKEDINFEYISVEHTGFIESQAIVNNLAIVGQANTLLSNLFKNVNSSESNNNNVPNFSFYWDSNDDGVTEQYTLFDLSFMELPLTNANLDDKDRFKNPMTIREFLHALIIFIAYVLFAIKVIKRVPVLFGGGTIGDTVTSSDVSVSNEYSRLPINGNRW